MDIAIVTNQIDQGVSTRTSDGFGIKVVRRRLLGSAIQGRAPEGGRCGFLIPEQPALSARHDTHPQTR